ncbi:MAG TPA: hypothetical protein VKV96_12605 [Roseiarcus sp.]|nr:hypothetical protein [Roseiarcus sp.]
MAAAERGVTNGVGMEGVHAATKCSGAVKTAAAAKRPAAIMEPAATVAAAMIESRRRGRGGKSQRQRRRRREDGCLDRITHVHSPQPKSERKARSL